jgi:hypothetical protein
LENELHLSADCAQLTSCHLAHVVAFEPDLPARGRGQPHNSHSSGGFAATGFADDAQRFTGCQVKIDTVHSVNMAHRAGQQPLFDGEVDFQGFGFDQRFAHLPQ